MWGEFETVYAEVAVLVGTVTMTTYPPVRVQSEGRVGHGYRSTDSR